MTELPSPGDKENVSQNMDQNYGLDAHTSHEDANQTEGTSEYNNPRHHGISEFDHDSDASVEIRSESSVRVIPMDDNEFCSEFDSFNYLNHEDYLGIHRKKGVSSLTARNYAAHVKVFRDWLASKGLPTDFEQCTPEDLNDWLSVFFKESHTSHGGTKKASSLRIFRSAIDRHLRGKPHFWAFSLTHSSEFNKANTMLHSLEDGKKEERKALPDSHSGALPLVTEDISKLWATGIVGVNSPKALQRLVFLGIGINFGITSRDDLRDLRPEVFEFNIDEKTGLEFSQCNLGDYMTIKLGSKKVKCVGRRMFSVPGSYMCPVAALKLFLKRRNPACHAFFQIPSRDFSVTNVWYRSQAAGLNSLSGMMRDMSLEAGLSKVYSNYNLRATSPIVLYKAMEDTLLAKRISSSDPRNKIALNTPSSSIRVNDTLNMQVGNSDPANNGNFITADSNTVCRVSAGNSNVCDDTNDPLQQASDTSANTSKIHHVLCLPQKWSIKDIITAVHSGEALLITKKPDFTEAIQHDSGEAIPTSELHSQDTDDVQNACRDRCGRKQREPKRLRRDIAANVREEMEHSDEAYMKIANVISANLERLDDLSSTQQLPSVQVVEELTCISAKLQEFLLRVTDKEQK